MWSDIVLVLLLALAALLYASVGHGGASGYIAVMGLFELSPAMMKPAALTMNIVVATVAIYKFYRIRAFDWHLFWPLALTSVPCAFIGGWMTLPSTWYKSLVGAMLLWSALRVFVIASTQANFEAHPAPKIVLLLVGGLLGLLSGLTGVGGGIFLSPLLLFMRWAQTKVISGTAAGFILVNSMAGLAGVMTVSVTLPPQLSYWVIAVLLGGLIGAELGSRRLDNPWIQRLLGVVLLIAGAKMLFVR